MATNGDIDSVTGRIKVSQPDSHHSVFGIWLLGRR